MTCKLASYISVDENMTIKRMHNQLEIGGSDWKGDPIKFSPESTTLQFFY